MRGSPEKPPGLWACRRNWAPWKRVRIADLAVWDVEAPAELSYRIGFNSLYRRYFAGGQPVSPLFRRRIELITLTPGQVSLTKLERIALSGEAVAIDPSFEGAVNGSAQLIEKAAGGAEAVYGVNTGFGKLAIVKITPEDITTLQRNLILSHCSAVGDPLDQRVVRLIMALKLVSLGRGASGVRWSLIKQLESMFAKGVIPVIPAQGSAGASGDLAPLAHMAAVMIGEGEAFVGGKRVAGKAALTSVGLDPIILGPKEGLALINGTQVSTALALVGAVQGVERGAQRIGHRRVVHRRGHGIVGAVPVRNPSIARPSRSDRCGCVPQTLDARVGNPGPP